MKRISAALALTAALSLGVSAYAQTATGTATGTATDTVGTATGTATDTAGTTTTTATGTGAAVPQFQDVPAGHWAREAVERITAAGLIIGFPDGTYRGNESLTRYQAALIIARLLDLVAANPATGASLDPATLEALQNAIQELSADLAQLGVRVADLEDNAVTRDDFARVEALAQEARDLAEAAAAAAVAQPAPSTATGTDVTVTPDAGVDPAAVQDLADQVEAASIAADTALAQARELQDRFDELNGRVDDLSSQLGELGATIEGQADSIAALNDLVVLLNQDVLSLQDRATQLESTVSATQQQLTEFIETANTTFATQEDLEALREFTTLLRRDQTALADRVTDVEARVTAVEGRVAGLEGRVGVLEANAFSVSGTLTLEYYQARTFFDNGLGAANDFDIDRLYFDSLLPGTALFSSGLLSTGKDPDVAGTPRDYADFFSGRSTGDRADDPADLVATNAPSLTAGGSSSGRPGNQPGRVSADFSLNLTFLRPRTFTGTDTPVTITLRGSGDILGGSTPLNIGLGDVATSFTIGGNPISVTFGRAIAFKFTDYAFNNDKGNSTGARGDGIAAALSAPGFIFSPTLQLVYGSTVSSIGAAAFQPFTGPGSGPQAVTAGTPFTFSGINFPTGATSVYVSYADAAGVQLQTDVVPVVGSNSQVTVVPPVGATTATITGFTRANNFGAGQATFFGARGTLSVIPGLTGGVYYAQQSSDIFVGGPDLSRQVYGADLRGSLFGLLNLSGEYSISDPGNALLDTGVALYARAGTANPLFGVVSLGVNYRYLDANYDGLSNNTSTPNPRPFAINQVGFGAGAGINLGFLTLNAVYDQFTERFAGVSSPAIANAITSPGLITATTFGAGISLNLLGFDISSPFFLNSTVDLADKPMNFTSRTENDGTQDVFTRTQLGVRLNHVGTASNALIQGLDIDLQFGLENFGGAVYTAPFSRTRLFANAGYTLAFGTFSIRPQVLFEQVSFSDNTTGYNPALNPTNAAIGQRPPAITGGSSSASNGAANGGDDTTRFGYGIRATTGPILFGAALNVEYSNDSRTHSNSNPAFDGGTWTASTNRFGVGVSFAQFILPNSTFSVSLANRVDINRRLDSTIDDGPATSNFVDVFGAGSSLAGLYFNVNLSGLDFTYGIFALENFADAVVGPVYGQAFKIRYQLRF